MTIKQILAVFLLNALLGSSCVTRTERVPYRPYAQHEDEGVLEELQRELGWHTSKPGEPFYKRAAQGVKETVSGWFHQEETPASPKTEEELEQSRHQFEEERQEAFRRLRERQEQERLE